ncbi:MAG: DUF3108 domain-containing protein [Kofleriaceae bacterium]
MQTLHLVPGETMVWDIHMGGINIGRAELDVTEGRVQSRFTTSKLASTFAKVHHELTTFLDPANSRPVHSTEVIDVDGDHQLFESDFEGPRVETQGELRGAMVPGGNFGHTLHSALGLLRAWSAEDAPAGYLYIAQGGELFRLDFMRPLVENLQGATTLRIECRVKGTPKIPTVGITLWLSDTPERTPLRIEIRSDDVKLTAELVTTDA